MSSRRHFFPLVNLYSWKRKEFLLFFPLSSFVRLFVRHLRERKKNFNEWNSKTMPSIQVDLYLYIESLFIDSISKKYGWLIDWTFSLKISSNKQSCFSSLSFFYSISSIAMVRITFRVRKKDKKPFIYHRLCSWMYIWSSNLRRILFIWKWSWNSYII